jgi:hypothetical protein
MKLNFKALKLLYIKPLLKPYNTYNKLCYEINLPRQKVAQNAAFLWATSKRNPIGKKIPNLVILPTKLICPNVDDKEKS